MKKLFSVLIMLLAINFLVVGGGVGWLFQSKKLDKQKLLAIKELVFPKEAPATSADASTTQPATQPSLPLDELLQHSSGMKASDQVQFIQNAFDKQMFELDRRRAEINARQDAVDAAMKQLAGDRAKLTTAEQNLQTQKDERAKLEKDQGFQDSLNLYTAMPAKQAKQIFLTLDDDTVVKYLQAMEPRAASKITREFKTPEEIGRIQKILEKIRQTQAVSATQ